MYIVTNFKVKAQATKRKLLQDVSGSIMPISAVAMIALAGMVGGGVDMSRAYMVQNKLQNACDSGVLAGRRAVDASGFTTAAKTRAETFFATNFDENNEGVKSTSFVASSPDGGDTVDGVASTTLDTVVMRLFNFDEIPLSVNCTASMSVGNSDVVMVLDVTGSMGWDLDGSQTRLAALKTAMKSFYDTVDAAADGGNSRIRYGFVPYSSGVNVGQLLVTRDADFIVDEHEIQSREAVYKDTETTADEVTGWEEAYEETTTGSGNEDFGDWIYHDGSYTKNKTCKDEIPDATAWVNDGASTSTSTPSYINGSGQRVTESVVSQPQSRTFYTCTRVSKKNHWVIRREETRDLLNSVASIEDPIYATTTVSTFDRWDYKEIEYDTSSLKTFASVTVPLGDDGADVSYTWDGCIEERDTTPASSFNYNSIVGITPSSAYDLDIDSEPDSDATRWRPMWGQVSYGRVNSDGYLTNANSSEYGYKTSYYCPRQSQLLTTMSESAFDSYADSLSAAGSTYHNVGMLWGARLASPDGIFSANVNEAPSNGNDVARHVIFMSDGEMSTNYSIHTAYGIEWHDRRVTANGYDDNNKRHTGRFLVACEAAKAKGIRVWVIAFATELTGDLETCASDDSAFTAASAADLNTAFQEIAKDVGELRITQ